MYDQVTDRTDRLEAILDQFHDDLTAVRKRNIEELLRRFDDDPLVQTVHLPDTSDIEGRCNGNAVRFTKTYRGSLEASLAAGERTVRSIRLAGHRVFYSGQLDPETMCISGDWQIRFPGLLGYFLQPMARGLFELYQKP
jgi:hypothetical protein